MILWCYSFATHGEKSRKNKHMGEVLKGYILAQPMFSLT